MCRAPLDQQPRALSQTVSEARNRNGAHDVDFREQYVPAPLMTPISKNAHGMWWELQRSHGAYVRGRPNAGAEGTAKAAGNNDTTSSPVADDGNLGDGSGVGNTLWEQMTAREGKDAAHRAGMRAGDWQAERQLQEALRESRQV